MRVLHISETHTAAAGGVTVAVNQAVCNLVRRGHEATIVACGDGPPDVPSGVLCHAFHPARFGRHWLWAPDLSDGLAHVLDHERPDVVHIHGCWMVAHLLGSRMALRRGIPLVFSAHGFLEPWLWDGQGGLVWAKKKLYWHLLVRRLLQRAALVHAITPLEAGHLRVLLGRGVPIRIIPNAVDVDGILAELGSGERVSPVPGRIVFLGRIDPKKGVELLLGSLARIGSQRAVEVLIVGPPRSAEYMNSLKELAADLGLTDLVTFVGPLYGREKWSLIRSAWVLAAPSHSEVVGLVNLEAAAVGTPTLTTHETGLSDWEEGGGVLVSPTVGGVAQGLEACLSWSLDQRLERGRRSRSLVRERYNLAPVGDAWESAYAQLVRN